MSICDLQEDVSTTAVFNKIFDLHKHLLKDLSETSQLYPFVLFGDVSVSLNV